jgi:hydrogenase expression/formation protein HypC
MCLGIPGRITATTDVAGLLMGTVDFAGLTRDVCLAYVPDARVGDYVVVHVGFAISMVDEAEAQRTLEILRSVGGALDAELSPEDALPPAPDGGRAGGTAA